MDNSSDRNTKGVLFCNACGEKLKFVSNNVIEYRAERLRIRESVYKCPECGRKATQKLVERIRASRKH